MTRSPALLLAAVWALLGQTLNIGKARVSECGTGFRLEASVFSLYDDSRDVWFPNFPLALGTAGSTSILWRDHRFFFCWPRGWCGSTLDYPGPHRRQPRRRRAGPQRPAGRPKSKLRTGESLETWIANWARPRPRRIVCGSFIFN